MRHQARFLAALWTGWLATSLILNLAIARPQVARMSITHGLVWLLGVVGLTLWGKGLEKHIAARERAEATAMRSAAELKAAFAAMTQGRDHFLAVLSHELRNPLAPIRNSLFILDRAVPGGEQARRAQAIIDRQVGHLTRLIDNILDVTRIARNKIRLQCEPLDLTDLVRRTVEDHRSLLEKSEVHLEAVLPAERIVVNADRTRLAQVVGNLLQNAAKFTDKGGSAQVSLAVDPAAGRAIIRVTNTGAGISPELLPRLFQPFAQADDTMDRSKGGLGLGLALVKGLVELHGGDISAHSQGIGKGAEFIVRLPLNGALDVKTPSPSMLHAESGACSSSKTWPTRLTVCVKRSSSAAIRSRSPQTDPPA